MIMDYLAIWDDCIYIVFDITSLRKWLDIGKHWIFKEKPKVIKFFEEYQDRYNKYKQSLYTYEVEVPKDLRHHFKH